MGEYADIEIEREIRTTGRRMMREHNQAQARKDAGAQEAARNLAIHEAREQAFGAALAVVEAMKHDLARAEISIERQGRVLEARHGRTVLGCWKPDKLQAVIRSRRAVCSDTADWIRAVIALDLGPRT